MIQTNGNIIGVIKKVNEREEFMQETQHTQQTTTRTAKNPNKQILHFYKPTKFTFCFK